MKILLTNSWESRAKMNKYAIITGVSSGIGECIATNFINEGVCVFGIDINEPNNEKIEYFKCNIADEKAVSNIFHNINQKIDHIDYLINSAGIFCRNKRDLIQDLSVEEWKSVIDINLTGTFLITKYCIPLLKKSSNGNIINLSSEQVVLPQIKSAPYAITKAGIEMFSKILALELMETKIRVNTIALAAVRTNFIRKYKNDDNIFRKIMEDTNKSMPFGIIEPEDVYKMVKFLVNEGNKITGQTILIDSGVVLNVNKKK